MKRRIAMVAGAVVVVSAALLVWSGRSSFERAPASPSGMATDSPGSGGIEAPAHSEPPSPANPEHEQAASSEPSVVQRIDTAVRSAVDLVAELPPLAQRIDDLTRRADAGDAVASCQLGLELMQCQERRPMRRIMAAWELQRTSGRDWTEHMPRERAKLLRLEQHCAGIGDARIDEVPRRMFAAADAGNAMAAGFSIANATQWVGARLTSDPDLVARLRDGYPRWLDRAFASGQPLFVMDAMQSARYGSPTNLNFQALARDPVAMRALDLLLLKVAADSGEAAGDLPGLRLAQSAATLDAATKARADVLAMRWFAAWKSMPEYGVPVSFGPDEINWLDFVATRPRVLHEACERG